MGERETILEAVRAGSSNTAEPSSQSAGYRVGSEADLWKLFERNLVSLGGRVIGSDELEHLSRNPKWVDREASKTLSLQSDVSDIWDAEVGFAVARLAIAQTGSLFFESGNDSYRMTTLAPPMSVILVRRDSIVPSLEEALAQVAQSERTCVLVTGPSRTADIEGVLVRGIHGPKELLVYILPEQERPPKRL